MLGAAAYYENQQQDLGKRFLASVQEAVNRIQVNARLYPVIEGDVRRCLARTFPYGVLFRIDPEGIVIFAVMHLRRDPGYWQERTSRT